jgi:hypothetical protein
VRQVERLQLPEPLPCRYVLPGYTVLYVPQLTRWRSIIPPARQDDPHKRGPGRPQGEFRTPQAAARDRLTVRRACGQPSESTQLVWRPVFSDISLRDDKGGFGAKSAKVDRQKGQGGYRHARTQDASLRAQATSDGARVRLGDFIATVSRHGTTSTYQ